MKNRFISTLLMAAADDGTTGGAAPDAVEDTALTADAVDDTNPPAGDSADDSDAKSKDKADDKGADGNGDQKAPETYADFTMPEGMELDSALLEQASPLFRELGLTQEQAQKLVDFQAQHVQASQQGQLEAFNQLKTDWLDQAKSDKEFGGDKFNENVATARLALTKFGSEGLTKLMNDYGIGNNPEMIRFMVKVGRLMKEDVPDDSGGQNTSPPKDKVGILYPKST